MIEKFGKTQYENWATDSLKCRQIVSEVLNFGVSQEQISKLIYLLALELEDRELMVQITEIINSSTEDAEEAVEGTSIIT
jgi:hypothetical protein